MEKELRSLNGSQTAKITALVTFFFMLLFLVPVSLIFFIAAAVSGGQKAAASALMGVIYLLMPLLYLVLVYLFMRLYCWLYNKVAAKFGGIRFTLADLS